VIALSDETARALAAALRCCAMLAEQRAGMEATRAVFEQAARLLDAERAACNTLIETAP
jgi:hypothetical protein